MPPADVRRCHDNAAMKNALADQVAPHVSPLRAGAATAEPRPARRAGDRDCALLLLAAPRISADGSGSPLAGHSWTVPADVHPDGAQLDGASILIAVPGDEVLVLPVAGARPISVESEDLRGEARALAAEWRRQRDRAALRIRISDWLIVYVDRLADAVSPDHVGEALTACAPLVVGTPLALAYTIERGCQELTFRPLPWADAPEGLPALSAAEVAGWAEVSVVTSVEARPRSAPYGCLAALFPALGAAQLLCAVVNDGMLLILVERRRDRIFTAEDRDLLGWIVKQARRALSRLAT